MKILADTYHPTTPATITDWNGDVWTYQPSPVEGEFSRIYSMGKRTATLMAHQYGTGPRRLISTSGKLLAKVAADGTVLPKPAPVASTMPAGLPRRVVVGGAA